MLTFSKIKKQILKHKTLQYYMKCIYYRRIDEFFDQIVNNKVFLPMQSYGEKNFGKVIYNLEVKRPNDGLCFLIHTALTGLLFCERMGAVPYIHVDQNNLYYDESMVSETDDVFMYYFEPMSMVTKEELLESACVVDSSFSQRRSLYEYMDDNNSTYSLSADFLQKLAPIYRKYFRLNERCRKAIDTSVLKSCSDKKTLGVHVRGTDMLKMYNNHPVVVPVEEYIREVRQAMETQKFEQVFIATDDAEIYGLFKKEFGDMLISHTDTFRSEDGGALHYEAKSSRDHHRYLLGLEVLRDVYTLAVCDGFISGLSNVSQMVDVVNGAGDKPFTYRKILSNGIAQNMKLFGKKSLKNPFTRR